MAITSVPRASLWTGRYGPATAGIFALAFMIAFESIAVLTVMPVVAKELDGLSWFAVSFAAPMATALIGLTVSGAWCDRAGPLPAMLIGVSLFSAGLIVAGLAPVMPVFLLGRAIQGLGSGLLGVALYVVIGRAFPEELRPKAFAVVTSAWTLPAIVGPPAAGFVSHQVGWRWVFLAVPAVAVATVAVLLPALRAAGRGAGAPNPRTGTAIVVAAGVLVLAVAGQREVRLWPVLACGALAVVLGIGPRLLLPGTWSGRRGLPSAIATRGLLSAGFFGAEAYFPLSLVEHRGLGTAASGAVLTGAALTWFGGAWSTANLSWFADRRRRLLVASTGVTIAAVTVLGTLTDQVPIWLLVLGWSVGGFGMGMGASTLSLLVIDLSPVEQQGANSAALQINDQLVQSTVLAVGSIAFAWLLAVDALSAYLAVMFLAIALVLTTFWTQRRIEAAPL